MSVNMVNLQFEKQFMKCLFVLERVVQTELETFSIFRYGTSGNKSTFKVLLDACLGIQLFLKYR